MQKDQDKLRILPLGIGDYFSRIYYCTSLLVFAGSKKILIDCPDPLRRMINDASKKSGITLDITDIDDVILTHVHGDHSNGLESLGFFKRFHQHRRARLYTISEVADVLWDNKLRASMGCMNELNVHHKECPEFEDYFDLHLLHFNTLNYVQGIEVKIRLTKHYVPCFGMIITYNGKTFGYSADTAFDPAHIDFLSGCDLIIHETNVNGHTRYEELLTLPDSIKQKMLLVHIQDDFDTEHSEIECAKEGTIYEI